MKSRLEQIQAMLADDPNDPFLRYGLAMEHVSSGDDAVRDRIDRDFVGTDQLNLDRKQTMLGAFFAIEEMAR